MPAYGPAHQTLAQSDNQELAQLFLTNAVAPVRSARILLPLLSKQKGVLAITSSQLASLSENPRAEMLLYSASKAAGTLITLHPGWVKTDMGGGAASLTAEESADVIVRQLTAWQGRGGHYYID